MPLMPVSRWCEWQNHCFGCGHPAAHEFFNQDLIAQLYPGFSSGAFFSGNWAAYSDFLTFKVV